MLYKRCMKYIRMKFEAMKECMRCLVWVKPVDCTVLEWIMHDTLRIRHVLKMNDDDHIKTGFKGTGWLLISDSIFIIQFN